VKNREPPQRKYALRPGSLADIAAASDNSTTAIVGIWRTMPAADQAALGVMLGTRSTGERSEPANFEQAIATQPVEALRRAKRRFTDAALRQRELNERDGCYRALARTLPPARSGYAMARAMQTMLERYRDRGPWRFDRGRKAPADPVMALMHRILTLDREVIRSRSTIERGLAGSRSKSLE